MIVKIHDPDPLMGFDAWGFGALPVSARTAIKSGLLRVHAEFLNATWGTDSVHRWDHFRKAFDVIADQFLKTGCLTETDLTEIIPPLVSNAAIGGRWLLSYGGCRQRDEVFNTRFGYWWVKEGAPGWIRKVTEGSAFNARASIVGADTKAPRGPKPDQANQLITAIVSKHKAGRRWTSATRLRACEEIDNLKDPPSPPVGSSWCHGLTINKGSIMRSLRYRSHH